MFFNNYYYHSKSYFSYCYSNDSYLYLYVYILFLILSLHSQGVGINVRKLKHSCCTAIPSCIVGWVGYLRLEGFFWREKQTNKKLTLCWTTRSGQINTIYVLHQMFILLFIFKNQCLFPILVFYCPILLGSDKKEIPKQFTVLRGNMNIF